MKSGNIASPTTDEVQVNVIEKDRQRLQRKRQKHQCGKRGSWYTWQQSWLLVLDVGKETTLQEYAAQTP